jgi:hypothetical protein
MDRLFQRPIICTYLAWKEAGHRGSWFVMLLVILMSSSVAGCVTLPVPAYLLEQEEMQRRIPVQWAETPEGLAYLRTRNYGVQKMMEARDREAKGISEDQYFDSIVANAPKLQPGETAEGLVLDGTRTKNADLFPGASRIVKILAPAPYDACSIYGMDQSKWLALTARDREHVRFRNFHHGYNDRHLPQARGTHSVPRATSPIITPHATQAEQPGVQRGMNWEDQYDYGGDGQNDGGGTGGFLP